MRTLACICVFAGVTASFGCHGTSTKSDEAPTKSTPSLPPIVVRDDSTGLTFSYVTLEGGFRQVATVADVPYEARDAVRVWSIQSGDGINGPYIYVADLRTHLTDGSYKVDVVARAYIEELASARREKGDKDEKGLGAGPAPGTIQPTPGTERPGSQRPRYRQGERGVGKLVVIVYGADWCQPCHAAEAYLKAQGIPFEHRDVDAPEVNDELKARLQKAGIKTHSIPVLDVGGKLLVGFSQVELDRAIADARR